MRRIRILLALIAGKQSRRPGCFCWVKVGLQSQGESQETKHSVVVVVGGGFPHSSALGPDNITAGGVVKLRGFSDGQRGVMSTAVKGKTTFGSLLVMGWKTLSS